MYSVQIKPRARRALLRIPNPEYGRIVAGIGSLANNARPPGAKKLVGSNAWRIRVGNYRAIYEIDDQNLIVTVRDVGHRSTIYR